MTPRFGASAAVKPPSPYTIRPSRKQNLRPQISVTLLPGIIRAAMVRVNMGMANWTPVTVVLTSSGMLLMDTVMADPEKEQMNWPRASGSTIADAAAEITAPDGTPWDGGGLDGAGW